jgi:hypothetical protein
MNKETNRPRKIRGKSSEGAPLHGKRVQMNLSVPPSLKKRLEETAVSSERSVSGEAVSRLERSFEEDRRFGGAGVSAMAMAMAASFGVRGTRRAEEKGLGENWIRDQDCYLAAATGVLDILIQYLPNTRLTKAEQGFLEGVVLTAFARKEEHNAR